MIHLAAEIASQRSEAKIKEANVEGTRRLLEACKAIDRRPGFLFASTVVTGDAHGELLDEETSLPVETAYGRSKQEGERLVRESGLDAVIIRPSHVYGPGGWFEEEFVNRLEQPGRFAVIGSGENLWDVVRVEDVARAFADAAERAKPGSLYHVADDEPIRFYDFVAKTAEALGRGAPRRVPLWLARLAAGPTRSRPRPARHGPRTRGSSASWAGHRGFRPRARACPTPSPRSPNRFEHLRAAAAAPVDDHVVGRDHVGQAAGELLDRRLQRRVLERRDLAAVVADDVVVVVAAGQRRLVARAALADLEAVDQLLVLEHLERPVDAGDPDLAAAVAQPVVDLLGREATVLLGEQLDHRGAGAAGAVAGLGERLGRLLLPFLLGGVGGVGLCVATPK